MKTITDPTLLGRAIYGKTDEHEIAKLSKVTSVTCENKEIKIHTLNSIYLVVFIETNEKYLIESLKKIGVKVEQ